MTPLLRTGVTYGGRYAIRRKLSRGAGTRTWLAEDLRDGCERVVRLQMVPGLTPNEWGRLDSATRQARIDAHVSELEASAAVWRLDNPYVAQIIRVEASAFLSDAFHPAAPVPALILEYQPGAVALDALTATWESVILGVLARLAEGLASMHAAHMAHGALCPDAVLVVADESGGMRPLLMGFGPLSDGAGSLNGGPAAYAPPEADSNGEADAAGDVWALGVLICRSLTGRLPFHTGAARAEGGDAGGRPRVLAADHIDLSMLDGDIRDIAEACLSFQPGARPSMVGIGARIRRLLGEVVPEVAEDSDDSPDTMVDGMPPALDIAPTGKMGAVAGDVQADALVAGALVDGAALDGAAADDIEAMLPVPGQGVDAFAMTMEAPAITADVVVQIQAEMRANAAGPAGKIELPQGLKTEAPPSDRRFAADPRTYSDDEVDLPVSRPRVRPPRDAPPVDEGSNGRLLVLTAIAVLVVGGLVWGYSRTGARRAVVEPAPVAADTTDEAVYEDIDKVLGRTKPETIVIETGLRTPMPPTTFGNARDKAGSTKDEASAKVEGEVDFAWEMEANLPALACTGQAVVIEKLGGQRWLRLPCRIECKLDTDDDDQPTALTGCSDWQTVRAEPGPIALGCTASAVGSPKRSCLGEGAFRLTETGEIVKTMVRLTLTAVE